MNIYQNAILAILITDQHSVHFINSVRFGLLQSTLVNFGPIRSNSVHFNSIRSIRSTVVQFGPFGQFSPLQSIQSNLTHTVHLGIFSPIWPTSIYSVHLVNFKPLRSNSLYLLKNGKIQVWVESTINYLSNINYNYMINFGYYNKLLKRMRFE